MHSLKASSARLNAQPARSQRGAFGTQAPRRRALVAAASARPSPVHAPEQQPDMPLQSPASTRRKLLTATVLAAAAAPAGLLWPAPAGAKGAAPADPGDWSSPGLGAPVDPNAPKFVKLPSGVRYQELNLGSGAAAGAGDVVLFDYVLRRSNGYFIYGTIEGISFQPRDVPTAPVNAKLGAGELIPGLEEVLAGMAPGSKRRALIPPELGYVGGGEGPQPPTFATKRQLETHRREPLLFEVQMLRVGGRK
ncbi:hypothetical protein HXX76_003961 [Chlamydomonas incerta]|uniref:peptidylprolyl isomerase n=1 Tax=Chlamydomonas incerta TaxID=51695 RepID=A0A835TIN6_CHLIN|nr:hypothetical protein HXX76_003961 [Chlamydomonas incerta]|eukprot:KAG2441109.1 hypothetical protein HXX76_003961 [Chlamydomonas incerta]